MQDLNDLYYFVQVVDHAGFAPAARALGVQKSKLSRRIALLEDRLGVRLIHRSTRRFSVTEIGQDYYRRCVAMLVEADAAQQVIEQIRAGPQGVIRMACPTTLLNFQFGALIARFMAENPRVDIHLDSTNRRVDVIGEGFDLAIRVRFPPIEPTDLVMKKLDDSTQSLVACPTLLAGRAAPMVPADLTAWPSLDMGPPHRDHAWCLEHRDGQTARVPHTPRLITDDMSALREAALAGIGIVQLPSLMAWGDIRDGRLVPLLPDWAPRSGIVHAVFPTRRGLLPSVRALVDFLADHCASQRALVRERGGDKGFAPGAQK
ncbi:LysR family transcriptional regulator [Gluconacetobacter azotocaptans]|uniref:LysR family transcriptional regulator n=1 Tax=Gluconacetobacter azotocaptans TaxID=142834 RepID=A0A7W4JQG0_9PROT|nr:LysR substrate-binding domain-containing protein [Gluconacetobacter azotocaptans]MBB2189040.1 LysR family transcriptional regulator [Gluconacetobacter azotocaptans]MBM9402718.1 LysR family transcriptional regulator [Gluconacetobacter azotocaptans]GBQ26956.1 LysR family transcriptional regulator [Gluconacetobacter azotocaptans DSM 13594]